MIILLWVIDKMYIYLLVFIFFLVWINVDVVVFGKIGFLYFFKIYRNFCNRYIVDNYVEKNLLGIIFKFYIYLKNKVYLY